MGTLALQIKYNKILWIIYYKKKIDNFYGLKNVLVEQLYKKYINFYKEKNN